MKQRCYNPNNRNFPNYGGRGITVCAAWRDDFAAFLHDMGPRPSPDHSLDRFPDNDGNYEPGNVRWATPDQQRGNMRHTIRIDGVPLVAYAHAIGLTTKRAIRVLRTRVQRGEAVADVVAELTNAHEALASVPNRAL
jgi:hypothetical protein